MSDPDVYAALGTIHDAPGGPEGAAVGPGRTLAGDAWETLRASWVFWGALVMIAILVVMAAFPGLFTNVDPASCLGARARMKPSAHAWFGYDVQGCDVYARTIYGARASIVVGSIATLMAMLLGAGVGI